MKKTLYFMIVLLSFYCNAFVFSARVTDDAAVNDAMGDYEALYAHVLNFVADEWDETTDCFDSENLERQNQALRVLQSSYGGPLDEMPPDVRNAVLFHFFIRQEASTGYFYDYPGQVISDRDKGRYLGYTKNTLKIMGAEPWYPYFGEPAPQSYSGGSVNSSSPTVAYAGAPVSPSSTSVDLDDPSMPDYMQSCSAYYAWLEERPWDTPWKAGDEINAVQVYIECCSDPELKESLLEAQFDFLPTKQNRVTGFWGNDSTQSWNYVSGAAKISSAYYQWNETVPRRTEIISAVKDFYLNADPIYDILYVRNPLWAFRNCKAEFSTADQIELIKKSTELLSPFNKSDGGFSRGRSAAVSDFNGTINAMEARKDLYLTVVKAASMPDLYGKDRFWNHPCFNHSGRIKFQNKLSGRFLSIDDSNIVVAEPDASSEEQIWKIEVVEGSPYIRLMNEHTGKYLQVMQNISADGDGHGVRVQTLNPDYSSMKWKVLWGDSNGYYNIESCIYSPDYVQEARTVCQTRNDYAVSWGSIQWGIRDVMIGNSD